MPTIDHGFHLSDRVRDTRWGDGTIIYVEGWNLLVRFDTVPDGAYRLLEQTDPHEIWIRAGGDLKVIGSLN